MELDEAKKIIIGQLASMTNGQCSIEYLRLLLEPKLGRELYGKALESLEREVLIAKDLRVSDYCWKLTDNAIKEYNIYIKPYIDPDKMDPETGMLRVVGSGGQTLDYISAPDKRECLYMCCGFIIVAAIIIFFALS